MMTDDIFRTVRELLQSRDCVIMGNAVNNEGRLYDDSAENLTRLLVMEKNYARMYIALESLVFNYAHFGRVTDDFVAEVGRILQEIDNG
jgi:hypothetical protein